MQHSVYRFPCWLVVWCFACGGNTSTSTVADTGYPDVKDDTAAEATGDTAVGDTLAQEVSVTDLAETPEAVFDLVAEEVLEDIHGDTQGGAIDNAGAWSAVLPGTGEFGTYEYRLFLWAVGGRPTGQIQIYAGGGGVFKGQHKLYGVEVTSTGITFRFAMEEEVRASLVMKTQGGKQQLVGTLKYYGRDETLLDQKDVTFELVGDPVHCVGPCLGQFCDMSSGQCKECDGECEEDCANDSDCPGEYKACLEAKGTCYYKCKTKDECGPNDDCIGGFCGFSIQFK